MARGLDVDGGVGIPKGEAESYMRKGVDMVDETCDLGWSASYLHTGDHRVDEAVVEGVRGKMRRVERTASSLWTGVVFRESWWRGRQCGLGMTKVEDCAGKGSNRDSGR